MAGLSYYIPKMTGWDDLRRPQASPQCRHTQCSCMNQDIFGQIAQITDHLYLCSLQALTPKRLHQLGVTQLVSVMAEPIPVELAAQVEKHIQIPVDDIDYANLRVHFDEVADRIEHEAHRGGKTVVHCMAGISRSATMVLAYLVKYQRMSLSKAYEYVQSVRPCIQPNLGFWRQLIAYEECHRGYRSMQVSNNGVANALYTPLNLRETNRIYPMPRRHSQGRKYWSNKDEDF